MEEPYLRLLEIGARVDELTKWEKVLSSRNYDEAWKVARKNRFGASHLDKKIFGLFKKLIYVRGLDSFELAPLLGEYIDSGRALSFFDYPNDPFDSFRLDYADQMPEERMNIFLDGARNFMFRRVSEYVLANGELNI